MKIDDVTIDEQIRIFRWRSGLKQGDVARRAGISQQAMSNIERGRAEPKMTTVMRIAAALGVSVGQLLGEDSREI